MHTISFILRAIGMKRTRLKTVSMGYGVEWKSCLGIYLMVNAFQKPPEEKAAKYKPKNNDRRSLSELRLLSGYYYMRNQIN